MMNSTESSEGSQRSNWRTELRSALENYFSEQDIELLCFDLDIPYDNLPGKTKPMKIVALIKYLAQRGKIVELIDTCSRQRQNVDWDALKQAAISDPRIQDLALVTDTDTSSLSVEEQPVISEHDTTPELAAPVGRRARSFVDNLPTWTLYLAIALILVVTGWFLSRIDRPAGEQSQQGTIMPEPSVVTGSAGETVSTRSTNLPENVAARPTQTPTIIEEEELASEVSLTPTPQEIATPTDILVPTATVSPVVTATATIKLTPIPTVTSAGGALRGRLRDGMRMRYVPGGSFQMGSEEGANDELPPHLVMLDAFWIDEAEVSNAQYSMCVAAGVCEQPGGSAYIEPSRSDHPVVRIDWENAQKYCRWVGGDLPTEAQWEFAAGGPDNRIYPWGNLPEPDCELANFDVCKNDTVPVGIFPGGSSWVRVLDMAGNVYEWTRDWKGEYNSNEITELNPEGPTEGEQKVIRGGSWFSRSEYLRTADRYYAFPDFEGDVVGFRCVVEEISD